MVIMALVTTAMTGPLLNLIKVDQNAPLGAEQVSATTPAKADFRRLGLPRFPDGSGHHATTSPWWRPRPSALADSLFERLIVPPNLA
jgi:hypothetical protein